MFNSREKESGKGLGHVLVVHIVAVEIVLLKYTEGGSSDRHKRNWAIVCNRVRGLCGVFRLFIPIVSFF